MDIDVASASMCELARAADRAGFLETFRQIAQPGPAMPLDETIRQARQRLSAAQYGNLAELTVWLTDGELVEVLRAVPDRRVAAVVCERAEHRTVDALETLSDHELWDLLEEIGDSDLHVRAGSMFSAGRAAQIAGTAVTQQWPGRIAARYLGESLIGTGHADQLLTETAAHTPTTLTLFAAAGLQADAELARRFADGAATFTDDGTGDVDADARDAFGAMLWFVRQISDSAQIGPTVGDSWLASAIANQTPEQFNVALDARWALASRDVTARAAALIDAALDCAQPHDIEVDATASSWVARALPAVSDDKLRSLCLHWDVAEMVRVAGHADPAAAARILAASDVNEMLCGDTDGVCQLAAAHIAGIVPVLGFMHSDRIGAMLCDQLIAATGGTAAGLETLTGLAPTWAGTVDELAQTVRILASGN